MLFRLVEHMMNSLGKKLDKLFERKQRIILLSIKRKGRENNTHYLQDSFHTTLFAQALICRWARGHDSWKPRVTVCAAQGMQARRPGSHKWLCEEHAGQLHRTRALVAGGRAGQSRWACGAVRPVLRPGLSCAGLRRALVGRPVWSMVWQGWFNWWIY
jgi:hypothetical protein